MDFFHSPPVPNFGNGFFHSLPVPELWEWIFSIPFPFPNWPFQSRESKGKMGDFKRCLYSNIFSFLYISYKIKMGVLKSKLHMWRCPIKQHPNFLCEKIISQPWLVQKPFLFHPDIFSLNTKWFYLFGTPLNPPGVRNSKMSLLWLFSRIPFMKCPKVTKNILGVTICVGKSGKKWG